METSAWTTNANSMPKVLQWGHRLSAMETLGKGDIASLSERHLQWGHRLSAMETGRPEEAHHLPGDPSMGPPPFGDGNPAAGYRARGVGVPSMGPPPFGDGNPVANGATAFRRRMGPPSDTLTHTLQWGHRLSAMETRHNPANTASVSRRSDLQWGHRLSAMETARRVAVDAKVKRTLQWGHRLSAMETRKSSTRTTGGATAFRVSSMFLQWGHRLSAMETPRFNGEPFGATQGEGAFNGATAFRRWKPTEVEAICGSLSVMDSCKSALFHKDRLQDK